MALVPPLATAGLAAASLDGSLALGALLLFVTNLTAIIIAAAAILFLWIGFHPNAGETRRTRTFRSGLLGTAALLTGITLILAFLTGNSLRTTLRDNTIESTLQTQLAVTNTGARVNEWQLHSAGTGTLGLDVVIQSPETMTAADADAIAGRTGA